MTAIDDRCRHYSAVLNDGEIMAISKQSPHENFCHAAILRPRWDIGGMLNDGYIIIHVNCLQWCLLFWTITWTITASLLTGWFDGSSNFLVWAHAVTNVPRNAKYVKHDRYFALLTMHLLDTCKHPVGGFYSSACYFMWSVAILWPPILFITIYVIKVYRYEVGLVNGRRYDGTK